MVTQIRHRKASEIYKAQNTVLHKAFAASGLPYHDNKEVWLSLMTEILKRPVTGLSDLSLGERQKLINHFQKKGVKLFSPMVPANVRNWKKGDEEVEYEFRVEDDPQVRMIYGMWAEMGYAQKTLRGLCFRRFKKDDPRWLTDEELNQLVRIVKYRAANKGCGNYYKRNSAFAEATADREV